MFFMATEAFVFIPGMSKMEKGKALDILMNGLTNSQDLAQVSESVDVTLDGYKGKQIQVKYSNGASKKMDFFEAYWNDLTYSLEDTNALKKLGKATEIMMFWLFSKVWRGIIGSKVLTLTAVGTGFVVLFWYYSILMLGFVALKSDPNLMSIPTLKPIIEILSDFGAKSQAVSLWLIISVLMTFVPVDGMVSVLFFTKEYLQRNELRHASRRRVASLVEEVIESGQYERITMVAYSFGVVVATDFLSNFQAPNSGKVRLVTLGGFLSLIKHRSDWLKQELDSCQNNASISEWIDYYSRQDWFATKTPIINNNCPIKPNSKEMTDSVPIGERLNGKVHSIYFYNSAVMNSLLQPANVPLQPMLEN